MKAKINRKCHVSFFSRGPRRLVRLLKYYLFYTSYRARSRSWSRSRSRSGAEARSWSRNRPTTTPRPWLKVSPCHHQRQKCILLCNFWCVSTWHGPIKLVCSSTSENYQWFLPHSSFSSWRCSFKGTRMARQSNDEENEKYKGVRVLSFCCSTPHAWITFSSMRFETRHDLGSSHITDYAIIKDIFGARFVPRVVFFFVARLQFREFSTA